MSTYLFIFIVGSIVIAIIKSLMRQISYEQNSDSELISTIDQGRIVNFDTDSSETQSKPVSS